MRSGFTYRATESTRVACRDCCDLNNSIAPRKLCVLPLPPRAGLLRSVSSGTLILVLVAAAGAFVFPRKATAGPDACTLSGSVATCAGNQSAGVSFINSGTVNEADLGGVTTSLTPASGLSAVTLQLTPANGNSGSLTIKADATLSAVSQNADGFFVEFRGWPRQRGLWRYLHIREWW